jgi:hypothetical protein
MAFCMEGHSAEPSGRPKLNNRLQPASKLDSFQRKSKSFSAHGPLSIPSAVFQLSALVAAWVLHFPMSLSWDFARKLVYLVDIVTTVVPYVI